MAAVKGNVRNASWRIVLVGSSDIAARALTLLFSSTAWIRSGFGGCECDVGSDRNASMEEFV